MEKAALVSSKGKVDLVVESDKDVYGIQFDLKYNPSELNLNGAESNLEDFTFEYSKKDDGSVRGLMFSMTGAKLNASDITSLIAFDFVPSEDFTGVSAIDFSNVIIAGQNGKELETIAVSMNVSANDLLPAKTALNASYPNPFNPSTTINYELASESLVNVSVYDALGRLVIELVNDVQPSGANHISWNAVDQASGAYFVRMTAGTYTSTQKLMLVK
tara:strand:- start:362 stop:1012 length:651 start_codon:yes stop_codon:yes gene_type:complete